MGQHDPLDGFITCMQLRHSAQRLPGAGGAKAGPKLSRETKALEAMCVPMDWATTDSLGIGELLADASRLAQLAAQGAPVDPFYLPAMLGAALEGLSQCSWNGELRRPPSGRLAFRELGLAIGLGALDTIRQAGKVNAATGNSHDLTGVLRWLSPYAALRTEIESYWLRSRHHEDPVWLEYQDINEVMLATSLLQEAPRGGKYLTISSRLSG